MFKNKILKNFVIFLIFVVVTLILLFIILSLTGVFESKEESKKEICRWIRCSYTCNNGTISKISVNLNTAEPIDIEEPYIECEFYSLTLNGFNGIENDVISKNWFSSVNETLKVNVITFSNSNFKIIEDGAFNSNYFNATRFIRFTKLNLEYLTNQTFIGLNNVEQISIEGLTSLKDIDKNVLLPMSKSIFTILFDGKTPSLDFIYTPKFETLSRIQLHNNYLNDYLDENSFSGDSFKYIKELNLQQSHITHLNSKIFENFVTHFFQYLTLSKNQFTTLQPELLQPIIHNKNMEIDISENPFICDCHLLGLQQQILHYKYVFTTLDKVTCTYPGYSTKTKILEAILCNETSTTLND